jgi:hypothetical protein
MSKLVNIMQSKLWHIVGRKLDKDSIKQNLK